jgi:hypothetical protein
MVCFRSRRLAAGLFVCSVVLGACGGKKDEGKSAAEKGGVASSVASNKDLDLVPAESEVVLGLDLAGAQKSALFRDLLLPMLTRSADVQKVVETLKTKCNIDPLTAATGLTAGIRGVGTRNPDVVAVVHGIDKAKALSCLDQVKEELAAERIEVTRDGDAVMMKGEGGDLAFTFTGDATAVVVMGSKADKEGVLAAAQGKSTLKASKEFADMYSRVKTSHTVWYLVKGDVEMIAKNLERLNVRSKAIFGSANVTDGLELRGHMRVETEEQATNVVDLLKSQEAMFGKMADKIEIDRDKNDVRTMVKLTQAQLKSVLGLLQSVAGGFR